MKMPKTTRKKTTNNSSSSGRPISSRTRQGASNLMTINNSSSSSSEIHYIPMKKNVDVWTAQLDSRRLVYISCHSWLTIDTYLDPLQSDKKDKKQIKKGDKFKIMNPLSDYNEVQVDGVSPNGKFCNILRINLNKLHQFEHNKSLDFLTMKFELNQGKAKIPTDIIKNQAFCRRKKTITKIHQCGYNSAELHPKKE